MHGEVVGHHPVAIGELHVFGAEPADEGRAGLVGTSAVRIGPVCTSAVCPGIVRDVAAGRGGGVGGGLDGHSERASLNSRANR